MITFKSPYDSTQIREGLMNIKQSQMELLKQLKNQNHILKKYTPENLIYEDKNQPYLYQNHSPNYSSQQNFQYNQKPTYGQTTAYISSHQNDFQDHNKSNSPTKNLSTFGIEKQLQNVTEDFHRIKKNYFNEKQKNKDMALHMEFAASLHNLILKDVLQSNNLENIKFKVRGQVLSYQAEFPEFKAFGLEQAFNMINLQSDSSSLYEPRTSRRTPIFPVKPYQQQSNDLLRQLNDLKSQLRELSLQKQRKSEQVVMIRSENDYTTSILNKEVEMKNNKINELVTEIIRQKQSIKIMQTENNYLTTNVDRLKSELQRNLNKIQTLEHCQRKASQNIEKQHKYVKFLKELQQKVSFLEKESKQKSKLIEIHQQNLNKSNQMTRTLKRDNQKLQSQCQSLKQTLQKKQAHLKQIEQRLQMMQKTQNEQLTLLTRRNQTEQASLKQHISELKKNINQLLQQEESYKLSAQNLLEIKEHKMQAIKLSKTIDHLWKIKEVEYENINEVLTQLNLFKNSYPQFHPEQSIIAHQDQIRKRNSSSRKQKDKIRSSSTSRSKDKNRNG